MTRSALLALFTLTLTTLTAQQSLSGRLCGNTVFENILHAHHPEFEASVHRTFDEVRQLRNPSVDEPLTIKVVVHIVWKDDEENLPDSIILDQIAVLNTDYNRRNPDSVNTREIFQPVAGSGNIHFELQEIIRVQTDTEFDIGLADTNLLPQVKHTGSGGSDAWDTDAYLNIWVCKIQPIELFGFPIGQILGFAFPPSDLPNWPPGVSAINPEEDGIVIDYRAFGSNNPYPLEIPGLTDVVTIRGRTTVHEVGHYLGLRHIWGDGGTFGPNDCAQSDGIDDTPFANAQSNFDCDMVKNSCSVVEDFYALDVPDMIENYMDYAEETCMNMYTKGQITHMRNVLLGPRSGLLGVAAATSSVQANTDLVIFPNPAGNAITVSYPWSGNVLLTLRSTTGQIVEQWSEEHTERHAALDISGIPGGVYILTAQGTGVLQTAKLMITQ